MVKSFTSKLDLASELGVSLPMALFMILVIAASSAILSTSSTQGLKEVKISEAISDSYYVAEGGFQDFVAQLGVYSQLWREKVTLTVPPANYVQYSPLMYSLTNGIPSCSGIACQRNLFPVGGGLLKNFGPIGGSGDTVNAAVDITQQLNPAALPTSDVTLNGRSAWYQVERLDETYPNGTALGGSLTNYDPHGAGATAVRFRVTATSQRSLKGKTGLATIIAVVELPPT